MAIEKKAVVSAEGDSTFDFCASDGDTAWIAVIENSGFRIVKVSPGASWRRGSEDTLDSPYKTKVKAQKAIEEYYDRYNTDTKLHQLGRTLRRNCDQIPEELLETLPRLTIYQGNLAAEFWYYTVDMCRNFGEHQVRMYAIMDIRTEKVLYIKSFTEQTQFDPCWESYYSADQSKAEWLYRTRCEGVLSGKDVSENAVMNTRAFWWKAQPKWMKNWVKEQKAAAADCGYMPYSDPIRFDPKKMSEKRGEKILNIINQETV